MLPDVHPMMLALGVIAAFALVGFTLQCCWLFVVRPLCRWIGGR